MNLFKYHCADLGFQKAQTLYKKAQKNLLKKIKNLKSSKNWQIRSYWTSDSQIEGFEGKEG